LKKIRLNRYLALAGVASRRSCDALIKSGRVRVDGEVIRTPGISVYPNRNKVVFDGKELSAVEPVTYLLNKPKGITSTAHDPGGHQTVLDLAREKGITERVFPVGRLDKKSRGLILLSNEGDLTYRLLHPRYEVEKVYKVKINLPISKAQMKQFASGLELTDGKTRRCHITAKHGYGNYTVILQEGRKRQIRRMFENLGRRVNDLQRVKFGPLPLGNLREGEIRLLSPREMTQLKSTVGLR
jgi:23S rRNA pseudouridine2605 synthase